MIIHPSFPTHTSLHLYIYPLLHIWLLSSLATLSTNSKSSDPLTFSNHFETCRTQWLSSYLFDNHLSLFKIV